MHARRDLKSAMEDHGKARDELVKVQAYADRTTSDYGERMFRVQEEIIGRFVRWLERHEKVVKRLDGEIVDGIELQIPELERLKFDIEQVKSGIGGFVGAGVAGASAQAAALMGVGAFASAGTGTAISSLTGVAAQNATLAWLGGGTLAAGGAGVAGGAMVLSFIAIVPAVAVGGLTVAWSGARQKRRVAEKVAEVDAAIVAMKTAAALVTKISDRVNKLRDVLSAVTTRTEDALTNLEAVEFDPEDADHAALLLRVVQVTRALREILNVPVIDENGNLTDESIEVVARYR